MRATQCPCASPSHHPAHKHPPPLPLAPPQAFRRFGLPAPILVQEQCSPDPDFPTVPFPNPEEGKGAWALAFRTAEQQGARLVFATDPDADRFAVAERDPATGADPWGGGGWQGWRDGHYCTHGAAANCWMDAAGRDLHLLEL